jgi:hypothetical protein
VDKKDITLSIGRCSRIDATIKGFWPQFIAWLFTRWRFRRKLRVPLDTAVNRRKADVGSLGGYKVRPRWSSIEDEWDKEAAEHREHAAKLGLLHPHIKK